MRLVVDTNIVFSAVLNSSSNIGKILTLYNKAFEFYSCDFLLRELDFHRNKLKKIGGLSDKSLAESVRQITQSIRFINEELILLEDWTFAAKTLKAHDPKDTPFVALSHNLRAHLWSGDKKLLTFLSKENYNKTITTSVIVQMLKIK